jgi:hypothetical protein
MLKEKLERIEKRETKLLGIAKARGMDREIWKRLKGTRKTSVCHESQGLQEHRSGLRIK